MSRDPCRSLRWLLLQLGLGLAWITLLATRASAPVGVGLTPAQVGQMLLLAGWLPSVALAVWQMGHRSWRALIASDVFGAGLLVLLACTAYVPLFFFHVVWFLPLALLPRGVLAELLDRLLPRLWDP
ncbi:hypothetical protein KBY71_09030 [Cyanobium sp. T1B-Tous]|uniref:hypothetical protein n=1 Tax=Cyanobium sp. T1B-Tous TaxID=2823721 RepID=UPI0020CBE667|nr:hypothetical protein [Cyanobium sp. T1B-Tous]MCP9806655.1 hypothetical protein [Cyanobium sp. T1B-Tous]